MVEQVKDLIATLPLGACVARMNSSDALKDEENMVAFLLPGSSEHMRPFPHVGIARLLPVASIF